MRSARVRPVATGCDPFVCPNSLGFDRLRLDLLEFRPHSGGTCQGPLVVDRIRAAQVQPDATGCDPFVCPNSLGVDRLRLDLLEFRPHAGGPCPEPLVVDRMRSIRVSTDAVLRFRSVGPCPNAVPRV